MHDLILFLNYFEQTYLYHFLMMYVGIYPMFGCVVWITCSVFYAMRLEKGPAHQYDKNDTYLPNVSVVISAYNEEKYITYCIESLINIDYPNYEIIVIDDGSQDNTRSILESYADAGKIRFIAKSKNEGKAMSLNDAIAASNGEIIFSIDADAEVEPDVLRQIVKHFKSARVGAVAGNPRVKNVGNFLTRMQLLEYTSIIGIIRRSQRVWGRIMSLSGVIFAVRRSAFYDVGGFSPAVATEDTDLTWKLQMKFWDIFYDVNAVVWVVVPETYGSFFRQRLRWSRGLMHVLRRYYYVITQWKYRRMWPVFIENTLSTLWAFSFVSLCVLWCASYYTGYSVGVSLIPALWGAVLATMSLVLQSIAIWLDRKIDPQITEYYFYTIYYPVYYWIVLAVIAVLALPAIIFKPTKRSSWVVER